MGPYKLPKWWLGEEVKTNEGKRRVTADEVNPECTCSNPLQAHFCMQGHMTECHVGMSCSEAECGHYQAEAEAEGDVDLIETDVP